MINVSTSFKNALAEGEKLYEVVDITFADGRKKTLDSEILVGGGSFTDCAESSSFPIGTTICKSMTLSLDNTEDQWKDYYFYKAKLTAYLKMQVSATVVETIKKGTYTITAPEQYGEILEFTALDDMYKANAVYKSNLALPQTAFLLLRDACASIGISMGFSSMEHGDVVINNVPEGITFRQLIGWVAMLDSANARVDMDGNLQLIKWDFDTVSVDYAATVDSDGYLSFGGGASVDSDEYVTPNGGNWYLDSEGYLTLREGVGNPQRFQDYVSFPTLSSDDIVITGIKVKNTESEAMYGKDGYVLELENDLLSDADLGTVAGWIGDNLIGKAFRSLEGDLAYNPISEFGDMAFTYDRRENKYITPITDITSSLNSTTTVKTQAEDPIRGESKFLSNTEKTIQIVKNLVNTEKSERQQAIEKLETTLKNSSGMYESNVKLEDGSTITYLHDKPLLEESKVIIKLTGAAIGVSNDGGKTYPYGFIVDGTLITRILNAEGISADWINSGTVLAKFLDVKGLRVTDADKKQTFYIDEDGNVYINANSLAIGGEDVSGLIADEVSKLPNETGNLVKGYRLSQEDIKQYWGLWSGASVKDYNTEDPTGNNEALAITELKENYVFFSSSTSTNKITNTVGRYNISFWARVRGGIYNSPGYDTFELGFNGQVIENFSVGNDWKKYSYTVDVNNLAGDGTSKFYIKTNTLCGTNHEFYLYHPEVTFGYTSNDIFNMLTNNGALKGLYKIGNELYFSFTYAQGGTLKLGGVNNGNGLLSILNASGTQVGYIDNTGVHFNQGEFSGNLKSNTGEIGNWQIDKTNGKLTSANGAIVLDAKNNMVTINGVDLKANGSGFVIDGGIKIRNPLSNFGDATNFFCLENMGKITDGTHLGISSDGMVIKVPSSSWRYKSIRTTVKEEELEELYRTKVVWAKYKEGYLDKNDSRYDKLMPMFLAEDMERRFPIAVNHLPDGKPEDWNYRIMIPSMFAMIKFNHEKIKELKSENEKMQSELNSIKKELFELKNIINKYKEG